MAKLQVRRISYALGAEVAGLDLKQPLDEPTVAAIRSAWLDHQLLCFPGQDLGSAELLGFAKRFGELEAIRPDEIVRREKADGSPVNIDILSNKPLNGKPWDGFKNGDYWHTDKSFTLQPTSGTFIACKEIPEAGGDTMFANAYMAYETLSPAMQAIVEPLSAIHDVPERRDSGNVATIQPLVRSHPETKRKGLYLSATGYRLNQIVGMTVEESLPLLEFLYHHAVAYEFTYRHRWRANDVVMWDNRCLMHIALYDYDLEHDVRHMIRAAIKGEPSGSHAVTPAGEKRPPVQDTPRVPPDMRRRLNRSPESSAAR